MRNQDLTKIARLIVKNKKIDNKLGREIIENLSRKDLAKFARILKTLVNKNRVTVISEKPLATTIKNTIISKYKDRDVVFEQQEIGDGIKLVINDTIIDLSVESYINSATKALTT